MGDEDGRAKEGTMSKAAENDLNSAEEKDGTGESPFHLEQV